MLTSISSPLQSFASICSASTAAAANLRINCLRLSLQASMPPWSTKMKLAMSRKRLLTRSRPSVSGKVLLPFETSRATVVLPTRNTAATSSLFAGI